MVVVFADEGSHINCVIESLCMRKLPHRDEMW